MNLNYINYIADLARIEISSISPITLINQFNAFLNLAKQMKLVNTTNIVPMVNPTEIIGSTEMNLREDVTSEISDDSLLKKINSNRSSHIKDDFYIVPRILD